MKRLISYTLSILLSIQTVSLAVGHVGSKAQLFVDSEATAQHMLDSFPNDDAKKFFDTFITSFQSSSTSSLLQPYILLIGEPGTGKTTIGYAVGKKISGAQVVEVSGEVFLDSYKNSCDKRIDDFFDPRIADTAPQIIIIDEFDKTVKKTQVKDFQDKDFLHLFLRKLDRLPDHILVILTANDEPNFNDASYADSRLKDFTFRLGPSTVEQKRLAVERHFASNSVVIDVEDKKREAFVAQLGDLNLREIDRVLKRAFFEKAGDKIVLQDLLRAISFVKNSRKNFYQRWLAEVRSNDTLRYFLYGAGLTIGCTAAYLVYQHINHRYCIEPLNQQRHEDSLRMQAELHAQTVAQQEQQFQRNLELQLNTNARNGGTILGAALGGIAGAGTAAVGGAKIGAMLGLKAEAFIGGASGGAVAAAFTVGGAAGGAVGYCVGPWVKAKFLG